MGTVTAYEQAAEYLQSCGLDVDIVGSDQTIHARGLHLTVTLPCKRCGGDGLRHDVFRYDYYGQQAFLPPDVSRPYSEVGCCPDCKATGKRTLRGEEKTLASLPKWLWPCPVCIEMEFKPGQCAVCNGSMRRGPKRPPAEWWWDVLEGVRCLECGGEGGWVAPCESCSNTGYTAHPHDFLMLKRIAKPGEAAYEWRVAAKAVDMPVGITVMNLAPPPGYKHILQIADAAEWARAVVKEK